MLFLFPFNNRLRANFIPKKEKITCIRFMYSLSDLLIVVVVDNYSAFKAAEAPVTKYFR